MKDLHTGDDRNLTLPEGTTNIVFEYLTYANRNNSTGRIYFKNEHGEAVGGEHCMISFMLAKLLEVESNYTVGLSVKPIKEKKTAFK